MKHEKGLALVVIGERQPCCVCGESIEPGTWAFWKRLEETLSHEAWHRDCDANR